MKTKKSNGKFVQKNFPEARQPETRQIVDDHFIRDKLNKLLHRTRDLPMHQRIGLSNAIHVHMAEYGIVAPVAQ